jgi:hypothetical protein
MWTGITWSQRVSLPLADLTLCELYYKETLNDEI